MSYLVKLIIAIVFLSASGCVSACAGAASAEVTGARVRSVAIYSGRIYAGFTKVILNESVIENLRKDTPKNGRAYLRSSISPEEVKIIQEVFAGPEIAFLNPVASWFKRVDLSRDSASNYLVIDWGNRTTTYWLPNSYADVPESALPAYQKIDKLCDLILSICDRVAADEKKTRLVQYDDPIVTAYEAALENARKEITPSLGV